MAPARGRKAEGRTAATSGASGRGRAAAAARTRPPASMQRPQEKPGVAGGEEKDDCAGFYWHFCESGCMFES